MKCPKCGYNSFEFHDSCIKCSNDLVGYKQTYGLKPIVLPLEARTSMAEALIAESALTDHTTEPVNDQTDMFSFDIPEDHATNAADNDPFNFDDEPLTPSGSGGNFSFDDGQNLSQAKEEEDAFADLLESTSQEEPKSSAPAAMAADSKGESDLTSFSWDDTPSAVVESSAKPVEDDFNSLFGDMDDSAKK
jgi:hypothetical protein